MFCFSWFGDFMCIFEYFFSIFDLTTFWQSSANKKNSTAKTKKKDVTFLQVWLFGGFTGLTHSPNRSPSWVCLNVPVEDGTSIVWKRAMQSWLENTSEREKRNEKIICRSRCDGEKGKREKETEGRRLFLLSRAAACFISTAALPLPLLPLLPLAGSTAPDGEPGYCPNGSSVFIITSAPPPPLCRDGGASVIDN